MAKDKIHKDVLNALLDDIDQEELEELWDKIYTEVRQSKSCKVKIKCCPSDVVVQALNNVGINVKLSDGKDFKGYPRTSCYRIESEYYFSFERKTNKDLQMVLTKRKENNQDSDDEGDFSINI